MGIESISTNIKKPLFQERFVFKKITRKMKKKILHFTLIDPDPNKLTQVDLVNIAYEAYLGGTDAIMVGGSTNVDDSIHKLLKAIRNRLKGRIPVILFPNGSNVISPYADAIFFMCAVNSKMSQYTTREQMLATPYILKYKLEPISMGYLIISPGRTVAKVCRAERIRRDDIPTAQKYAIMSQLYGMQLVYLEAGSGARFPVPDRMISEVKNVIDLPLIVGGGLNSLKKVYYAGVAGADIIVTGTCIENSMDVQETVRKITATLVKAWRVRVYA